MNLDNLIKYLVWIVFFSMVLIGMYLFLRRLGIL